MRLRKKEILVRVGERLFAQYGYRDVSVTDITQRAGFGTGSFYIYFPSKEAFFNEILDKLEQESIEEIDRVLSRFQSPLNKLKAIYRFVTLDLRKNSILRGILIRENRFLYPGIELREHALSNHLDTLIENTLREGLQRKALRISMYKNPKQLLFAIYNALLLEFDDQSIGELLDDVLVFIERGFKRRLRLRKRDERIDRRRQWKNPDDSGPSSLQP